MTLAAYDAIEGVAIPTKIEALQQVERAVQFNADGNKGHASFWEVIIWIADNHAWLALDYADLNEMWNARFAQLEVGVTRSIKQRVVESLVWAEQSQQQIASKTGLNQSTVSRAIMQMHNRPESRTNSRGEIRSTSYAKKIKDEWPVVPPAEQEKEMPATLAHNTPYKPGYVLATDTKGYDLIEVGEDGRAHGNRKSVVAALEYARNNPREPQYTAVKNSGISKTTIVQAYSSLRRNDEIPPQTQTGRKPAEEFALIAMAIKNLGLSIDRLMEEGTLDYVEADDTDFYIDGMKEGLASIKKFGRETDKLRNPGQ